jgi:uncharacterized BrkB/YihY/UPF0761 family membrane protein
MGGLGLRVILTLDHQSSSSVHVDSPGGVWEARIAGVLWLVVLRLLLGLVVVILLLLLLLLLIMRRRLLLLLLILLILRMLLLLLLLLLLTVLIVATTTRVLHHRIESLVHASDSSCTTRGRAVRGEVFALGI